MTGYADALPADVLLLCGIFGNVSDPTSSGPSRPPPPYAVRARS